MFNRRFLRIKVFQAIYAFHQENKENRNAHFKSLTRSLDKVYELYVFLMALPAAFKHFIHLELDAQKNKYIPVEDAMRILETINQNKVLTAIENNTLLNELIKKHKCHWDNNKELFKQLWGLLKTNEAFISYSKKSAHTFAEDKAMVMEMYEVFIGQSETFENYIEERYINWEDDQVLVFLQVMKSIQTMTEHKNDSIQSGHLLNPEDEQFVEELFNKTILHGDELANLISSKTKNWDAERLALVDMLLMQMALAEVLYFEHIPVKVSINEYLELAKLYSTPNSHGFINGVLDKIHIELKNEKKLHKVGRGLVE